MCHCETHTLMHAHTHEYTIARAHTQMNVQICIQANNAGTQILNTYAKTLAFHATIL